jgi:FixJ family two-component response regulator
MTAPVVFVVEDDLSVREALVSLVRSADLQVEAFASAGEFLAHTRPDVPCCLVLDVRLPGPSGLDLQSRLAQLQEPIPIIFITGHGDIPMSVRAIKAGAMEFLTKPFRDQDLLAAIEHALERDRARRREHAERSVLHTRYATLTPREREVMTLVVSGRLNKQSAAELGITETTVKVHRHHVMAKMDAGSLADLVRMWEKLG